MKLTKMGNEMRLRDISFEDIARQHGTPFYLYDLFTVEERIERIRSAFKGRLKLYYAMKANPNMALLKELKDKVDGLDIASGGELKMALEAGYDGAHISFAGPGKTRAELAHSLAANMGYISVESLRELQTLHELVEQSASKANVFLRINPDFSSKEFAIKMGGRPSPFGIEEQEMAEALAFIRDHENSFDFQGIHIYSGTQCLAAEPLAENLKNTLRIAAVTAQFGLPCKAINIGGGFGVPYYSDEPGLDMEEVAGLFLPLIDQYQKETRTKPDIILELGRYLVAEAGIYVTRVVSDKLSRGEQFYVLDGGMNHHLAASGNLGATIRKNYRAVNLSKVGAEESTCSLVGPLCTPMDLMGKSIEIQTPEVGELIGFLASGSYGYSASPLFFLGHELPAEVLVT